MSANKNAWDSKYLMKFSKNFHVLMLELNLGYSFMSQICHILKEKHLENHKPQQSIIKKITIKNIGVKNVKKINKLRLGDKTTPKKQSQF
jgi:hypothetical protein